MKVALTGEPGVGKTTVCREVADRYPGTVGGMLCGEVREDGDRVGFRVEDLATGERGWLAKKGEAGPSVGRYAVRLDDLERVGVAAVKDALETRDLVVIDEVGPMEFASKLFVETVKHGLDSDRDLLLVVHHRSGHPIAERVRDEAELVEVTKDDRDGLPDEVLDLLT